jgi:hypothetical protein
MIFMGFRQTGHGGRQGNERFDGHKAALIGVVFHAVKVLEGGNILVSLVVDVILTDFAKA